MTSRIRSELADLIESIVRDTGADIKIAPAELAAYVHERTVHLSSIVGEPGYDQAFTAECDSVRMKAGLIASDKMRAADARLFDVIVGAMRMAAFSLAG